MPAQSEQGTVRRLTGSCDGELMYIHNDTPRAHLHYSGEISLVSQQHSLFSSYCLKPSIKLYHLLESPLSLCFCPFHHLFNPPVLLICLTPSFQSNILSSSAIRLNTSIVCRSQWRRSTPPSASSRRRGQCTWNTRKCRESWSTSQSSTLLTNSSLLRYVCPCDEYLPQFTLHRCPH